MSHSPAIAIQQFDFFDANSSPLCHALDEDDIFSPEPHPFFKTAYLHEKDTSESPLLLNIPSHTTSASASSGDHLDSHDSRETALFEDLDDILGVRSGPGLEDREIQHDSFLDYTEIHRQESSSTPTNTQVELWRANTVRASRPPPPLSLSQDVIPLKRTVRAHHAAKERHSRAISGSQLYSLEGKEMDLDYAEWPLQARDHALPPRASSQHNTHRMQVTMTPQRLESSSQFSHQRHGHHQRSLTGPRHQSCVDHRISLEGELRPIGKVTDLRALYGTSPTFSPHSQAPPEAWGVFYPEHAASGSSNVAYVMQHPAEFRHPTEFRTERRRPPALTLGAQNGKHSLDREYGTFDAVGAWLNAPPIQTAPAVMNFSSPTREPRLPSPERPAMAAIPSSAMNMHTPMVLPLRAKKSSDALSNQLTGLGISEVPETRNNELRIRKTRSRRNLRDSTSLPNLNRGRSPSSKHTSSNKAATREIPDVPPLPATPISRSHRSATPSRRSPSKSGTRRHSKPGLKTTVSSQYIGFVNFTASDSQQILSGVAPSGSSKTKARREKEALEKRRKFNEVAAKAIESAARGGDVSTLTGELVEMVDG